MAAQIALIVAQMYLGIITAPRPVKHTFEDLLEANKGDETRPIPYIRGRWKTKPQRIWLGDFSARAVERDSVWSDYLFFGPVFATLLDTITVSYRYYVGQGFALTWGPINRVHQVYVDDLPCAVAPVVDNAGGSLLLDDPGLFGGDNPPGEGGVYGVCDVIAGNYTQGRNTYIQSIEGNIPALHGVAALVVRGRSGATESGYFSAGVLNLREWQVELMAWPDVLGTSDAQLPDQSYNRIHAMYEWATNADFGAEYPASQIHLPSWRTAAETVFTEGLGFSGEINTGGSVGNVFDELKASVDAEVYEHPRDGLKIKLIRKDYSIPSLPVLDYSNTNSIDEYTPGDYADTFNRITLDYINAANNYQPRPAVYEDPANRTLQQRSSPKTIQYPGVASAELAQKLVTRDGRALGQPFPPLICNGGEVARSLWPGDVYKFEWSNPLISKIFRVHARTPGLSYDGEKNFKLSSTEDQYSIGMSVFGAPEGTDATNPATIWATAPPSATWDVAEIPPEGLEMQITGGLAGEQDSFIRGAIEFGVYAGGQYARVYVTPPGGVETLTPIRLSPDTDNKAQFTWPALIAGAYQFCIQTYSLTGTTNGTKVCETISASSPSMSPSASTSPSPSLSVSPSSSQSPSSSESPSISPSPSVSPSLSPSASVSASASVSPSLSPSSSVSLSISPSASTSPSSSASPSAVPGPDSISDLELWLKADAITGLDDGDEISMWVDSSGNGNDATGVVQTSLKPTWKATAGPDSMPAVRLVEDGPGGGYFSLPDFVSGFTEGHYFVVLKHDSDPASNNAAPILTDWGSSTDEYFPFLSDSLIYNGFGSSVRKNSIAYSGSLANWRLDEVRTASGAWSEWMDGTSIHSTGTNTVAFSTAPFIAHGSTSTRWVYGLVAEIIFYSRVLSAGEITTIKDYLTDKYGLTIA